MVYKRHSFNFGGPNLLLGRTSFSVMLKVVMSEPPFRDQPYEHAYILNEFPHGWTETARRNQPNQNIQYLHTV